MTKPVVYHTNFVEANKEADALKKQSTLQVSVKRPQADKENQAVKDDEH